MIRAGEISFGDITLPINGDHKQGCFYEILARTKEQMDAMLTHHCHVLAMRLDLHIEDYTQDNQKMSKYMRKIRKKLKARYSLGRVGFVWVREVEKSKKQHYHLGLLLDGNKVHSQTVIDICSLVAESWDMFVYVPENCYYRIRRGDTGAYNEAFKRFSYMAKERGKGYKAATANDYSTSRIKPKAA